MAVTFLAVTLVAVGGTTVLGGRRLGRAVAVQQATRLAASVLDSLTSAGASDSGSRPTDRFRVVWSAASADAIRVQVSTPDGEVLAVLEGAEIPVVPVLPDAEPPR